MRAKRGFASRLSTNRRRWYFGKGPVKLKQWESKDRNRNRNGDYQDVDETEYNG